MSKLIYDPQARLYSTVSAYGKTWELTRIESDGAQHWQSGKESAVVQKMAERDTEGPYAEEEAFTINSDAIHPAMYDIIIEAAVRAKRDFRNKDTSPEPWVFDGLDGKVDFDTKDSCSVSCDFEASTKSLPAHAGSLHPAGHSYQAGRVSSKSIDIKKIF